MTTDREMLQALLGLKRGLTEQEEMAFPDMLERLDSGMQKELTRDQRKWVAARYYHFELDTDEAVNMVSSGQVPKTDVVLPYELLPRPLAPPGRK